MTTRWTRLAVLALLAAFTFTSCASSPKPLDEKGLATYKNTKAYLLDAIREELKAVGKIASEDAEAGTLTLEWKVQLSPFDQFGTRTRLVVKYTGDETAGFDVTASQETEVNTNQKSPLEESVADWSPSTSDGNLAVRFLQNLDRRMRPNEAWKERRAR